MAKGIFIGVSGAARKTTDAYIGVSGVARKVKNGFIGVSGVAREFWSGGTPSNFADLMSRATLESIGGYDSSTYTSSVHAYDLPTSKTCYVFGAINGSLCISKLSGGSFTVLYRHDVDGNNTVSSYWPRIDIDSLGTTAILRYEDDSNFYYFYGGTIAAFSFDGVDDSVVDEMLSNLSLIVTDGRSSSSEAAVVISDTNVPTGSYIFAFYDNYVGISIYNGGGGTLPTSLFGNNGTNPYLCSIMWSSTHYAIYLYDGTFIDNQIGGDYYGGSIMAMKSD